MNEKYLIQLLGTEGIFFLGRTAQYTEDIQDAVIFNSAYDAQVYIEKHRLNRLGIIRKIQKSDRTK